MIAALYGTLAPHAWRDPGSQLDASSLFYHYSIAMGWLDDRSAGGCEDQVARAPGLWAMNDAGWSHPLTVPGAGLISWFQVEVSAVADDRPLPVQPFLRCAQTATARAGAVDLAAIQLLLPVHGLDPAARAPYAPVPAILTQEWFAEGAAEARTQVEVNVNSGQDQSVAMAAQDLIDRIVHLDQDVFRHESYEVTGQNAVVHPPFDDRAWNGPPLHSVVLRGELAEWSPEAIGWVSEMIADSGSQSGIRSPLLLTITRNPTAEGTSGTPLVP
ncbi:hypothetical protein [Streptomyces sp. JJ38]|uniref:hypothetical protein n=1 Tax=Streptomyces sp. JJ38 TaxID=2738128 RepID=UPI00214BE577|nr:hypothetical protein [Streptomyces sp. JJ38]